MKEIRTQAFVREGAFDGNSDSTHFSSSRENQDDLEMKPHFPTQESEEVTYEASENNSINGIIPTEIGKMHSLEDFWIGERCIALLRENGNNLCLTHNFFE